MSNKIIRWFTFSVIIALLPIFFNFLVMLITSTKPTLQGLLSHGELLLVSVCLAASALGEIIGSGSNFIRLKIVASGGCVITLTLSSLCFAFITALGILSHKFDIAIVTNMSISLYFFSVITSASCVYLGEK